MTPTAITLLLALAPPTHVDLAGRFRLQLETPVLQYQHVHDRLGGSGVRIDYTSDKVSFVGGRGSATLGFGYALTEGLVIGATLATTFQQQQSNQSIPGQPGGVTSARSSLTFLVRPYLEYAFIPHGRVRPFVFVRGGLGVSRQQTTQSSGFFSTINRQLQPTLGGGAGAHIFVIPQISIDLFAHVDHTFSFADVRGNTGPVDTRERRGPDVTDLGLGFGISAWFGGRRRATKSR